MQAGKDDKLEDHQRLTILGDDYYETQRHKSCSDNVDLVSGPRGAVTFTTNKQEIEQLETPMYVVKQAVRPAVADEKLQRKAREQVNKTNPEKTLSIDMIETKDNVSDASNIFPKTISHTQHGEVDPRGQVKESKSVQTKHQRNTDEASHPETVCQQ